MTRQNLKGQRTEITVEHHEIVILRRPCEPARRWCEDCGAEVDMVTAEQGACLAGVTPRIVYRWLEAASVHFLEGRDGSVLICTPSILKLTKEIVKTALPGGLK